MSYKNLRFTKTKIAAVSFGLALTLQALVPFLSPSASATPLLNTLVRFDRLAQSQQTTGTVCAKTSAVNGTEASVKVTFPTGFTLGSAANFTVSTTNLAWPTGATAWLGINTATNVTSQDVTFPSSDLATSTLYCFNWINSAAVLTGTAGNYSGAITTQTSTPTAIDTGTYAVTTVGVNADQVTVNATVNPSFSLVLANTTDNLGALSVSSVSSSPTSPTATVNTNAANGWYLWGRDSNQGLNSTTASYTVPSVTTCNGSGQSGNSTLGAGTEGYNLGAVATSQSAGTGTVTIATTFVGGSAGRGGGLCSTAGTYQTIASSNGTASNSLVTLTNNAAISGITKPATDYTDTETFVGAGLF